MTETTLEVCKEPPKTRLLRYLYVGKECPEYQPGNWFVHDYFTVDRVPSIEEMVINEMTETELMSIIVNVFTLKKQFVQNFETIVFALAVCARQNKSEKLRHLAYSRVLEICKAPQHFLLFIKFADQITKENDKKHGWGHGWKNAVDRWYKSQSPMQLAECVTRFKSRYGWTHKDIVKLSHIPTYDKNINKNSLESGLLDRLIVRQIIFCYVMNGIKEVHKLFGDSNHQFFTNKPNSLEVIKYLEMVEDFKHCEDEIRAAGLIELNNLTLDHVPGHLLKSEEVWNALIISMDITTLLQNLQRINNLGFLKKNSITVSKVVDALSNQEKTNNEKIHPAYILITIRNYENSGRPLSYEKRKIREEAKKQHPPPPEPNQEIIDALYKLLNFSFSNIPVTPTVPKVMKQTELRYLITIDVSKVMQKSRVWHCGNLNGSEVGCMIALSLLHTEKNVTVATFINNGIYIIDLDKNSSFDQALKKLQQLPTGTVNLSKPMSCASNENKKYDVFINVVDQISIKNDTSEKGITTYRTKMNLPKAKLINCVTCNSSTQRKEKVDENILTICGFDEDVPKIIEAFSNSYF